MSVIERARAHADDEQAKAVAEAFRNHAGLVERLLRRAGVAERDLDDVRQDVFIVVHRRLPEFEGRASLTTWLYRIALHVASDYRRRAYQRREQLAGEESTASARAIRELPADGDAETSGVARDPEQRLEQRELLEHALRALEQLDPDKREAFVLAELYGLPMREVAARMGCPQKTAFSRTYAARRRILAELHKHGALPVLPLFFPLRALRGLELHSASPGVLAPAVVVVPLAGAGTLVAVAAAVLIAVLMNREPAAPRAAGTERASGTASKAEPVARALPTALRAAPVSAQSAVAPPRFAAGPAPRPRVRRAAHVMPSAQLAVTAMPVDPLAQPQPAAAAADVVGPMEEEMQIVRSGAVDLRPTMASPLASAAPWPADTPPRSIRVRGPSDAADELERALDADPVFARPIALH